jgi:hypothetical protein
MAVVGNTVDYYQADNAQALQNVLQAIGDQISCCGNGDLDVGEKCDTAIAAGQAGACPTSCDDGDPKTVDTLEGLDCNQHCVHQDPCGNGKLDANEFCDTGIQPGMPGACPRGCNDGDPGTRDTLVGTGCKQRCEHETLCGNGKIDGNELCDTKIPAGQAGACPKDCDDGDPKTEDQLTGKDCQQKCVNNAYCGNGKLDAVELCDTAILPGRPGACPKASDCKSSDPCGEAKLDGSGCQQQCIEVPKQPKIDGTDGCCPPKHSSYTDADCPPPCGPDRRDNCVDLCAGVTCPAGEYCTMGGCQKPGEPKEPIDPITNGQEEGPEGGSPAFVGGCQIDSSAGSAAFIWSLLLGLMLLGLRRKRD